MDARLRWGFLNRSEEDSHRRLRRGLTVEELGRALRRYPGNIGERNRE